ncbi:MAG: DUF2974 domain-containing protein, partial [Clostridia bacterium]|nr:DUF2974 domain-containing protein [Clostridia bacterium]
MNIVEWANYAQDKLKTAAITEADSLLLCELAYLHWEGYQGNTFAEILAKASDDYIPIVGTAHTADYLRLLEAVGHSARFADVVVADYVETFDEPTSCQFAGVLFDLGDGLYYALRGTDGTLVGWKEDLDLLYNSNLASQTLAKEHLNEYAARYPARPIIVGGHSKGGNLAEFAAIFCHHDVERRILKVFNHDGPGFHEGLVEDNPQRKRLASRIAKTVPEFSVFGLMLNGSEPYEIVRADAEGIWQHYPYNWRIEATGSFERTYRLDSKAILIRNIIETMLPTMPGGERMMFVHTLYQALRAAEVERVGDLKSVQTISRMIKFNRTLPKSTKNTLWKMFFRLLGVIARESASRGYRDSKPPRVHKVRSASMRAARYKSMRVMHEVKPEHEPPRRESEIKSS